MEVSLIDQLRQRGFVVLHSAIDPDPIAAEMDRVFLDALPGRDAVRTLAQGTGTVTFRYVPMMCERTPVSLALLDRCSEIAAQLLGLSVLPGRAKGTRYYGDTGWHRDSGHDLPSLAFVAYLDPVQGMKGSLRVLAGSHADPSALLPDVDVGRSGEAVESEPGDLIVFDEHIIHGSSGGGMRRQWRVDFVIDPRDAQETANVERWFDQSIPDERQDPGYDADRYPSYGSYWQTLDRPWTRRLQELGVYLRAAR